MSHSQTVIIAPNLVVADALYAIAPTGLLVEPDEALSDDGGRVVWIHNDWPEGFEQQAELLGCTVVDYFDEQSVRWDAPSRENFTPKQGDI